jgi:hypothetical protein
LAYKLKKKKRNQLNISMHLLHERNRETEASSLVGFGGRGGMVVTGLAFFNRQSNFMVSATSWIICHRSWHKERGMNRGEKTEKWDCSALAKNTRGNNSNLLVQKDSKRERENGLFGKMKETTK